MEVSRIKTSVHLSVNLSPLFTAVDALQETLPAGDDVAVKQLVQVDGGTALIHHLVAHLASYKKGNQ